MPRVGQDLRGKRFGKLVVLKYAGLGSNKRQNFSEWVCQCDCGNTCIVAGYLLQTGRKKSCGCLRVTSEKLPGQRFGKLTVLEEDRTQTTIRKVICRCDCGNTKSIAFRDLKSGRVTSCGCDRVRSPQKNGYFEGQQHEELERKRKLFVSGDYKEIDTLCEWIYVWLLEVLPGAVKDSTCAMYGKILEKHVLSTLGKKKFSEITFYDMEQWLEQLQTDKVSGTVHEHMTESTIRNIWSILNSCMRDAKKYGLIRVNPCSEKIKIVSDKSESLNYLNEKQMAELAPLLLQYRSKEDYPLGIGFQLILYTGVLLSEAVALRWADIDQERKSLTVNNFYTLVRESEDTNNFAKYQLEQASGCRKREIPIPNFFFRQLMDVKNQFMAGEDTYVVNPYSNKPMNPERMRTALARKGMQAGFGRVTPQMLRDTYAMRAVKAGASSEMIAELMGLSSNHQVMKRYMLRTSSDKRELISRMYDRVL